ncbi:MAG: DUF6049 family protein, partial [Mycobacteriales bacterium]
AFPRDWHPADVDTAGKLLAVPANTPWLTGTTVPEAVARTERAPDRGRVPRYPPAARRAELPANDLSEAHQLRTELRSFGAIIAGEATPEPGATDADRAKAAAAALAITTRLRRAEDAASWAHSAHWRRSPASGARLRAAIVGVLHALRGQVYVENVPVRLTSTRGSVPITVFNRLDTPVRVRLSLRSERLGLSVGRVPDIVVPAAHGLDQPGSRTVEVALVSQTIGKFPVVAQLRTPDDDPLGAPTRITVSTTAYGRVALLVTVGAFALLVLASLARFVFRRRRDGRGGTGTQREPDDDDPPEGVLDPSESQPAASVGG